MPESSESANPRRVFEHLVTGITAGRWEELPALYADDAVIEFPFATRTPARLEGRQQIREHFSRAAGLAMQLDVSAVTIHETADPEVIVAEFNYGGTVTTTGRSIVLSNVQVMRVHEGRIVTSRDYHNHSAIADALG